MELAAQRIGKRIQTIRKEKGLTQTELGEKVGKSESTIRKYEAGAVQPSLKILTNISKELNIDVSYFLKIDESELTESEKQQLMDFESQQIQELDWNFSNIKRLISCLVETDMFKKEFNINYETLSNDKQKSLIDDIYKSIDYNCFKINEK